MSVDLVGREIELDTIASALDSSSDGLAVVLLEGDVGVGKTTVWRAALDAAGDRFRTLVSRPAESEREVPFVALGDLLERVSEESLARLPEPQRRALEIALLRTETLGTPLQGRAVSLALLGLLRALSEVEPLLIAVDDVQWLDPASARALEFAVRRLEREPVAVLAAQRLPQADGPSIDLGRDIPDDRLHRLRLRPLELDPLARLVRERVGVSPPRPQLKWLHGVSGGNPFIAIELAKTLPGEEQDFDSERPLQVPTSLRELAHRRLAALSGPEREAALVTSGLARPTVAALGGVLGPGGREAIGRGVEAGVLDLDGDRVRLTHPLLGSVLYAEATFEERRELHLRLARVPNDPEERARHLALAADGPDAEVALALEEAAHTARFRGALEEAARLAERARELTPEGQAPELSRRTLAAAEYHFDAGSLARAHALLAKLAAEVAPGPERAEVLVRIAEVRFAEEGWEAAIGPLDEALIEAGDDLRSSANVERRLAWGYHAAGDMSAAEKHAAKASALAETLGEPALVAQTVSNGLFLARLGGGALRHDEIEAAIALEHSAGRMPILERPSWQHAVMLLWADDLEGARSIFERLDGESVERGDETSRPFLLHYLARIECRAGRLESAERLAQEALEMTIQTGQDTEHAFTLATCALIDAHLGHVEAARAGIAEGLALASRTKLRPAEFELLAALGSLELSLGDAEATVRVLAPLADAVVGAGFGEPSVYRFHANAIEALVATGRLDEADAMLAWLERHGDRLEGPWVIASAGRCRGLLLAARRDLDGAGRALETALQAHDRLPEPLERARTLLVLGAVRRRQKKKGAARDALEEACLFFDGLPAPLWAERARGELARLGGRPTSRWDLTETERRIAELVAEGRTNREVADALFISVKTVEWNLSKVYGKLGIRSRTELASKAGAGTDKPGDSPGS